MKPALDLDGAPTTAADMAERSGLKLSTVYKRLQAGKSPAEILATPVREHGATLDGRVFGKLTVLRESARKTAAGKRIFLCRCECGTEKEIIGADLRSGRTISCGCVFAQKARERALARAGDITGQRFGKLVVVGLSGETKAKSNGTRMRLWECRCDCGKTVVTHASPLRAGQTTSCGCRRSEVASERADATATRAVVFGETVRLDDLASVAGMTKEGIRDRLRRGMSPEQAAFGPRRAPAKKVDRRRSEHKCRRCGQAGHNARSCTKESAK